MKYLVLLIPCVLALWVPLFNVTEPTLGGVPFFYWFQIVMIPASVLFIWVAAKIEGSDL
ncbi:MAG: DUF3311 domain-containing protein [Ancalomicrobiaceae bacterium]|nr:DUF3311 domain-containing protein [Ancalomicrobiaceae bacterium]